MWSNGMRKLNQLKNKLWSNECGATLIEVILIIVILGITVIPISRLSIANNIGAGKYITISRAVAMAQSTMESVIADWLGSDFDTCVSLWSGQVITDSDLTATVTIGSEMYLNGVTYAMVTVDVSGPDINDVGLEAMIMR
jgi:hypothetical protein